MWRCVGGYRGRARAYAVWLMDADDCEAVAAAMPSGDKWVDDLLSAAAEIRRLEADP